jgi:hypothetical protein
MQSVIPTGLLRIVEGVEREAIARERRRRQALEQLEFEREREAALRDQLEDVITEQVGTTVDEAAFARMLPEDVEVVREALVGPTETAAEDEVEATLSDWGDEGDDDAEDVETEIARLESALADCARRQQAYQRYLDALGGGDGGDRNR